MNWKGIWVLLDVGVVTLWLALPEFAFGRAGGVAVVRRWTESALLAAVLDEEELDGDGEEEENNSNDGNGESSLLKSACGTERWQDGNAITTSINSIVDTSISASKWSIDISTAAVCTSSQSPGNIDESTHESHIEQHAEDGEKGNATETAYQDECKKSIHNSSSRDTLDGTNVGCYVQIMVDESSKEVREDSEDDSCAAEFDSSQEERNRFEGNAAKSHDC